MIRAVRILVPVNGNPTDEEAVALACEVARRGKAAVYAIYVIEVKRTLPLDVDLPPEAAKGDTVLGRAEHVADEFGIELETEILQARDVGTAIVDEALEREVDLIVMGIGYNGSSASSTWVTLRRMCSRTRRVASGWRAPRQG